jgi:hypothetical protein
LFSKGHQIIPTESVNKFIGNEDFKGATEPSPLTRAIKWGVCSFNFAEYFFNPKYDDQYTDLDDDLSLTEGEDRAYFIRNSPINLVKNHALVLTYDSERNIEVTLERFKRYEFIYWTLYDHRLGDSQKYANDRFRLIFPFHRPISSKHPLHYNFIERSATAKPKHRKSDWGAWTHITDSLIKFAGEGCISRFVPSRVYSFPNAPEKQADSAKFGHNTGEKLNWKEFERGELKIAHAGGFRLVYPDDLITPTNFEEFKQQMENREPTEPEYVPFYDENGRPLHFVKLKNKK